MCLRAFPACVETSIYYFVSPGNNNFSIHSSYTIAFKGLWCRYSAQNRGILISEYPLHNSTLQLVVLPYNLFNPSHEVDGIKCDTSSA